MPNEREAVVKILEDGIMNAWDWAIVQDETHQTSGRAMAEAALRYLESNGFKVVRREALRSS